MFAIYYIGLIGGESLANKNIISPFWAMWADNIIFLAGRADSSSRGWATRARRRAADEWVK